MTYKNLMATMTLLALLTVWGAASLLLSPKSAQAQRQPVGDAQWVIPTSGAARVIITRFRDDDNQVTCYWASANAYYNSAEAGLSCVPDIIRR